MPIFLKDNINTKGMPTTAGAIALADNKDTDGCFYCKTIEGKKEL